MPPQQPQYGPPPSANYDFIVNAGQPTNRRQSTIGGGNSVLRRILIAAVGLIVLIVAFAIIKGIITGGGNSAAMLLVVQDQQAIIHITTAAKLQTSISTDNKNLIATTAMAITSQQSQLIGYLATQHQKIAPASLNGKVSAAVDKQLTDAATSNTYDQTLKQVMKSELTDYATALQVAYKATSGPKGKAQLKAAYDSAVLLDRLTD